MLLENDVKELLSDYGGAYDAFPLPAFICDRELTVHHKNRIAGDLYPAVTAVGKPSGLLGEYTPEELMERIDREGSCTLSGVMPLSTKSITLTPILARRKAVGVVLLIIDDKPGYQSLNLASRTADALDSSLRDSVGNIFGEMDTLALKADFLQSGWIKAGFNRIGAEAYRILRVASNIAEYSRIQNGELDLQTKLIDLAGGLYASRDAIIEIGKGVGIPVECNITEAACFVRGDQERLDLAVYNILHNSFYYTRPGNRIVLNLEEQGGQVILTIRDRGAGIPEQMMPDIWRPYVSCLYTGRPSGVGLGLTLAKAIIEAHGGEILLKSGELQGTCVTIRLPAARTMSAPLSLAQEDGAQRITDRFSCLYTGLADIAASPYSRIP